MKFNWYDFLTKPFELMCFSKLRKRLLPLAYGNVLKIGVGTGANLKHYNMAKINQLTAIDLSLSNANALKNKKICLLEASAENLPFSDDEFDCVVFTMVLCSVGSPKKAIEEIKRVLKPNGKILCFEHILPHKTSLRLKFKKLNKFWYKLTKSCQIDLETDKLLLENLNLSHYSYSKNSVFFSAIGEKC